MVAHPQMSNGYRGTDSSWQAQWLRVLNQPFSPTGCVTLRAQVHTHPLTHTDTQSTRPLLLSYTHTYTRAIKSNGVCPVAGRESPLMSGSHNDIIAVDGACWGILFHTIGMLQTSSHSTHWWWWQKLVLTPDLLVDGFDKKPQRADSSLRQENCCYFQLELWWCCFLFHLTKTDTGDHYQRDCDVLLHSAFEIQGRRLYHLLDPIWPKIFAPFFECR